MVTPSTLTFLTTLSYFLEIRILSFQRERKNMTGLVLWLLE